MKVGFVQTFPKFGKKKENIKRVLELIETCDAHLLVLPELYSTGYLFQSKEELFTFAEEIPGETTSKLTEICQKKNLCLVAGIAEREGEKIYNTAVMITKNGSIGKYRKIHLFLDEKDIFAPGNLPLEVFSFHNINIGMMVCFDWCFPEVSRVLALKGAHILCQPANLVLKHCQKAMVTRSIENRVFTITANRIGFDQNDGKKITFTGASQVTSPEGKVLIAAPENSECVQTIEIDFTKAFDKNITPKNHIFEDRRVEYYKSLL